MTRYGFILAGAAFALPLAAVADEHMHHHPMEMAAAKADAAPTEGTVKKIDKAHAMVTLTHGPIVNLGMDGMTMAFKVKEPKQLDGLKTGDKVRFVADMAGSEVIIVRLEAVK